MNPDTTGTPKVLTLDPNATAALSSLILTMEEVIGHPFSDLDVKTLRRAICMEIGVGFIPEPPIRSTVLLRDGRVATRMEEEALNPWIVSEGHLDEYMWEDWEGISPLVERVLVDGDDL